MSSLKLFFSLIVLASCSFAYPREKRAAPVCYEDLGCFEMGGPFFNPIHRPVNPSPSSREKINTRFLLYTTKNLHDYQLLRAKDKDSITGSNFDAKLPTKFIVHGFLDNQLFGEWMKTMKNEFLIKGQFNVIIVDWSGGNGFPYAQASSNTRIVGAEIALLITKLQQFASLSTKDVHIIGHSLGAHVAGYAGERVKVSRISAMDAAQPNFQHMPIAVRLDPTDAEFVDAIHTDDKGLSKLGFGMSDPVGHIDFYPNNGHDQPGCSRIGSGLHGLIEKGIFEGGKQFASCNHQRSIELFIASINHDSNHCTMMGYSCKDYDTFDKGECGDCGTNGEKCVPMGLEAEVFRQFKKNGAIVKTYLKTTDKHPYCLPTYQVKVTFGGDGKREYGVKRLTLHGPQGSHEEQLDASSVYTNPGETVTYLITSAKPLGKIDKIYFQWRHSTHLTDPSTWKSIFKEHRVYVKSIQVEALHLQDSSTKGVYAKSFCNSQADKPLSSGQEISLSNVC